MSMIAPNAPNLQFANDGSFLENFLKLQKDEALSPLEPTHVKKCAVTPDELRQLNDSFLPSPHFQGAKPGFFFGCGTKGVGYYRDDGAPRFEASGRGNFFGSSNFQGAKPGFFFGKGVKGLGYYRDNGLVGGEYSDEVRTAKSVTVKSNNPIVKSLKRSGDQHTETKKQKLDDTDNKPRYLKEMERYKSLSCGADTKHDRPLVK